MAGTELSELVARVEQYDEPQMIQPLRIKLGGVDPLGLRQVNFDLMDLVIPSLNNVARHIRPYTVIAWAWHQAALCARESRKEITADELQDFVDRIEVIFAWSQFLRDDGVDLPGHDVLAPLVRSDGFRFGGSEWKRRRETRRFSTALSAPVNYGPAVKALGWIEPSIKTPGAFRSSEHVKAALQAFSQLLGEELAHPAFSKIGPVTVARDVVKTWAKKMSIDKLNAQERSAMRESLTGEGAPEELRQSVATIIAISKRYGGTRDSSRIRSRMCRTARSAAWLDAFEPVPTLWARIQVRQLFRLAMEGLLYWTLIKLSDHPARIADLAREFLSETRNSRTTKEWLSLIETDGKSIPEHIESLRLSLTEPENLASGIHAALAVSLANVAISPIHERSDRLPLARASEEAQSFASSSPLEFLKHVLGCWIIGQHVYWSIGRGLADARSNGRRILRLRVVSEESGFTLAPGALLNRPRPTPDRLETLLSLMAESGLLE